MIHIFYRHYQNDNLEHTAALGRPDWFSYKTCFNNMLHTIKNTDASLTVMMDGEVSQWIDVNSNTDYSVHQFDGGSDSASATYTYKYIQKLLTESKIKKDDLIYVAENDYLHISGWVEEVETLFTTYNGLHYVSLYDHNDKYISSMYSDLTSKIFTTSTHHWRSTPSTCGTYIARAELLMDDLNDHLDVVGDHNKWIHLNHTKQRFILTPIPGLSTHCMEGLLSPTIKWQEI